MRRFDVWFMTHTVLAIQDSTGTILPMQSNHQKERSKRYGLPEYGCPNQFTRHAAQRAQQRTISKTCVPLIHAYGKRDYDGRGGVTYFITDSAIDTLMRVVGRTPAIERLAGVYIVVDADSEHKVITIGHCW